MSFRHFQPKLDFVARHSGQDYTLLQGRGREVTMRRCQLRGAWHTDREVVFEGRTEGASHEGSFVQRDKTR